MKKIKLNEITDYDNIDTSVMIDLKHPKRLSDLNIELSDECEPKVEDKSSSRIVGKGKGKISVAKDFDDIPTEFEKYTK